MRERFNTFFNYYIIHEKNNKNKMLQYNGINPLKLVYHKQKIIQDKWQK